MGLNTPEAMPEKKIRQRAMRDKRKGRSPSTQAGEFVREEMHHIREGKHGARSARQAIAIGLSKARQAGVDLLPPPKGKASEATRRSAARTIARAKHGTKRAPSPARSRATTHALRHEGTEAASPTALGRQARRAAAARSSASRSASARKAARTKGPAERSRAARKAARTRSRAR